MAKHTKAPTGLSIKRDGMNFTFQWKKGETYERQWLEYRIDRAGHKDKWKKLSVGKSTISKVLKLSQADYYPSTGKPKLNSISFRVKGDAKKKSASKWTAKTMDILVPHNPSILGFDLSESESNAGTFSWTCQSEKADKNIFTDIRLQSLLTASFETDGSKLPWRSSSSGWIDETGKAAEGSRKITEDTSIIHSGSPHARWLRLQARGPQGTTEWKYAKHIYAQPQMAVITSASALENDTDGLNVTVAWNNSYTSLTPIDHVTVQYTISTPMAELSCADDASWTDAGTYTIRDTTGASRFSVDQLIGEDCCLFVRVNTLHDGNTTYGKAAFVRMADPGVLKVPTLTNAEINTETEKVSVTASSNTSVPDAAIRAFVVLDGMTLDLGDVKSGTETTVSAAGISGASSVTIGIYSYQGNHASPNMRSKDVIDGGSVPHAPTNVTAVSGSKEGSVLLRWTWDWPEANGAEISWSDSLDAWNSTEQPSTYDVSILNASEWIVSGLDTGKVWYFRVRLYSQSGDNKSYGPYNGAAVSILLSSTPNAPILSASENIVSASDEITLSWAFDSSSEAISEIAEVTTLDDGDTYSAPLLTLINADTATLSVAALGWENDSTHHLAVRITEGTVTSSWSDPVSITIAAPLSAVIASTSLQEVTVTDDEDESTTRTVLSLTELPLTIAVSGAGDGGTTILAVERTEDYRMERPDESTSEGFTGETAALIEQIGEAEISIGTEDLIGALDDGAAYQIVATVKDGLGRSDTAYLPFEVHWSHQAIIPSADITVDAANLIVTITPIKPDGALDTDVCDIYRLSSDKPELIFSGASFGESYVDPYPAFGPDCGHRVVMRTANGDYITAENLPAWTDYSDEEGDVLNETALVIDFDGDRAVLPYNVKLDHSWEKDFERTRYLGGSITGDWNEGVTRDLSVSTDIIRIQDNDLIQTMRRLADFAGICHVRTSDGSSFAADVEVSESREYNSLSVSFSLDIKKVEAEEFDGMTLTDWKELQEA
jgi:hypothetical protein